MYKTERCRDNMNIIKDRHFVCKNCGQVHGDIYDHGFIDFYENRHRIVKRNIYHRKYDIVNTLYLLNDKYNCNIDSDTRRQILQVFRKIETVIAALSKDRKRMVDVKYIIKRLLDIKGINTDNIPVTRSKKHYRNIRTIGRKF